MYQLSGSRNTNVHGTFIVVDDKIYPHIAVQYGRNTCHYGVAPPGTETFHWPKSGCPKRIAATAQAIYYIRLMPYMDSDEGKEDIQDKIAEVKAAHYEQFKHQIAKYLK